MESQETIVRNQEHVLGNQKILDDKLEAAKKQEGDNLDF